jgi:hypothetical protein
MRAECGQTEVGRSAIQVLRIAASADHMEQSGGSLRC